MRAAFDRFDMNDTSSGPGGRLQPAASLTLAGGLESFN